LDFRRWFVVNVKKIKRMMRSNFLNKRNLVGILISGLAGFLVLTYTGLGGKILAMFNRK
jgi:hypothetical protein